MRVLRLITKFLIKLPEFIREAPSVWSDLRKMLRDLRLADFPKEQWVARIREAGPLRLDNTYGSIAELLAHEGHVDEAIELVRLGREVFPESKLLQGHLDDYEKRRRQKESL